MDINNFRCSICLEIFSNYYTPCTLYCGHSLCIDHIANIKKCPVCKQTIKNSHEIKPNCVFRDISKEFIKMNKHAYTQEFCELIEQEKIALQKEEQYNRDNFTKNSFHEIKKLKDNFTLITNNINTKLKEIKNLENTIKNIDSIMQYNINLKKKMDSSSESDSSSNSDSNSELDYSSDSYSDLDSKSQQMINCNCGLHKCDIYKRQKRCCFCLDERDFQTKYIKYIDGRGPVAEAKRYEYYCPSCVIYGKSLKK
jgi:hypothetical protein